MKRPILPVLFALLSSLLLGNVRTTLALAPEPWVYRFPQSGSRVVSTMTTVALRAANALDPATLGKNAVTAVGHESGAHPGEVRLAEDGRTLLFSPNQAFAAGEVVDIRVADGLRTRDGAPMLGTSFSFTTLPASSTPNLPDSPVSPDATTALPTYRTYPELGAPMPVTVTVPASGTAPGLIFAASMGLHNVYEPGAYIFDNSGEPVFIHPLPPTAPRPIATDFKKQTVAGQDFIVYHGGWQPNVGWTNGAAFVLDTSYALTAVWTIGNGYEAYGADLHEIQLLNNGHAILLSYVTVPHDLSPWGGPANGSVIDIVIQEQDASHAVVFEWHGVDHVSFGDTYSDPTGPLPIDYLHTNAIEPDADGNLLVSNRNTSDVIKVNRTTGAIMWRLGGKQNGFSFTNDGGFSLQHDIRRLANGNITLFDNGNVHTPSHSRQVEYEINETTHAVTRTWQFPAGTDRFTPIMGNAQRLPNGNTIGSWAVRYQITEVAPDGNIAFDLSLGEWSYRGFRYPWSATPQDPARLATEFATDPTTATLFMAWNGATDITAWEVLGGPSVASMTTITTVARNGFETRVALTGLPATTCAFQARPVRASGPGLPLSNIAYRPAAGACAATMWMVYLPVLSR